MSARRLTGSFTSYGPCLLPRFSSKGIDEARSDRYRRRGRFGRDAGDGDGECPALSPLRRSSNLYVAALYPPKPRTGSPRRRSADCSVFRIVRKPQAVVVSATIEPSRTGQTSIYSHLAGLFLPSDRSGLR